MKNNKLGPNGAIMTSLNIFVARYLDEFVSEIQKQCEMDGEKQSEIEEENNYSKIVIDTPGQLEVFTWSASG